MKLYTPDGCAYEGMDADTVTRLRTELGRETVFTTQDAYDALCQAALLLPTIPRS